MSSFVAFTPSYGHLDPPADPPLREIIYLMGVVVFDDMDTFAAGELSLDYEIIQPGHTTVTGTIPGGSISGTQTAPGIFPGLPTVIYDHLNCDPLERDIAIGLQLKDSDVFGFDTSDLALAFGNVGGQFTIANKEFAAVILVLVVPAPQPFSCSQPVPPGTVLPPPPDNPEDLLPPSIPDTEPPHEPGPDSMPGPELAITHFEDEEIASLLSERSPFHDSDFALTVILAIIGTLGAAIIGIIIFYRMNK